MHRRLSWARSGSFREDICWAKNVQGQVTKKSPVTVLRGWNQNALRSTADIPKLLRSIIGINELINTYYRPSNNR